MCHWPHEHGCTVTRVSQKANYSRFLLLSLFLSLHHYISSRTLPIVYMPLLLWLLLPLWFRKCQIFVWAQWLFLFSLSADPLAILPLLGH